MELVLMLIVILATVGVAVTWRSGASALFLGIDLLVILRLFHII